MNAPMVQETVQLGKTDVNVPPLGIGAWQWGDRWMWGFGSGYSEKDVKESFDVSVNAGVNFFDTAEVYGNGKSERLLGQFAREYRAAGGKPLVIATKIVPFPWRLWPNAVSWALKRSLKRLQMDRVDLYQVHFPVPPLPIETLARQMGEAVRRGLTRTVGVSNFNAGQTRRFYETLQKMDIPLASNQVEYSLIHRDPERNGLMDLCRQLGVTIIAYSPLGKGMLTGKYTPENLPPGLRGREYNAHRAAEVQPLIRLMREIGQAHGGKTPAQVSLNWIICKGAIPIPGAKNARQAQDNIGALGWRLSADEVSALDEASKSIS